MRIKCKKRAECYKPVKGNEKEIIKHLSNNNYYNYWDIEKDYKRLTFRIGGEVFFTNEDNSFFKCESDGEIKHIMKKYEFINYIAIPFLIIDKDILKIFQAQNFMSFKRDGTTGFPLKNWSLKTTTETFAVSHNDIIIFNEDEEIVDCLINDSMKIPLNVLTSHDYIVK